MGTNLIAEFWEYHDMNPHVYDLFKKRTFQMLSTGRRLYSSRTIIAVVRFDYELAVNKTDDFKINDHFTAAYSRMFAREFPQHIDFFEYRTSIFDSDPRLKLPPRDDEGNWVCGEAAAS